MNQSIKFMLCQLADIAPERFQVSYPDDDDLWQFNDKELRYSLGPNDTIHFWIFAAMDNTSIIQIENIDGLPWAEALLNELVLWFMEQKEPPPG